VACAGSAGSKSTTVKALGERVVSANAYVGAAPIVACLEAGAQIVLGGRLADPSLFVGPICHELGWALDDWDRVGQATLIGHMLECGVHSTGGSFEDPPYRVVPDPHRLGFPVEIRVLSEFPRSTLEKVAEAELRKLA
jgi:hypothetical protein